MFVSFYESLAGYWGGEEEDVGMYPLLRRLAMMAAWNLHVQRQYILDYCGGRELLGRGNTKEGLLSLSTACVWFLGASLYCCVIQVAGLHEGVCVCVVGSWSGF